MFDRFCDREFLYGWQSIAFFTAAAMGVISVVQRISSLWIPCALLLLIALWGVRGMEIVRLFAAAMLVAMGGPHVASLMFGGNNNWGWMTAAALALTFGVLLYRHNSRWYDEGH